MALLGALGVPVVALILAAGIALGSWLGVVCVLVGVTLSAALSYGLGSWLGREAIEGVVGGRFERVQDRIARRGLVSVILVRVVPVAPFAVINMVAGASRITLRDLLIGTLVGMTPGVIAMVYFGSQLLEVVQGASLWELGAVAALAVGVLGGGVWLDGKLGGEASEREEASA